MHIYISNFCHTFSCNQLKTMKLATRKINCTNEMPTKNFCSHEIPTNTRWHNGTRPTRPTRERGPQNLAHSYKSIAKHVPSKHSSWWRRLEDVFRLRLQKTSSRRLQEVLIKTNMFTLALRLQKTSSRRLGQDQYICLGHVSLRRLQDVFKTPSRRLDQDEYVRPSLTSSEDVLVKTNIFDLIFKTSSRRL